LDAQARAMLDSVGRLVRAVGLDYGDVVRSTVYLRDFGDFAKMNEVYRTYFPTDPPARATVGVTALAADYSGENEGTPGGRRRHVGRASAARQARQEGGSPVQ